MNIFFLDRTPSKNAKNYYNRHVVKIILEITQMLYTVARHYELDVDTNNPIKAYRPTHAKHPMTIWMTHSIENIDIAFETAYELCIEYTRRYTKIHKCFQHIIFLRVLFNSVSVAKPIQYKDTTFVVPLYLGSSMNVPLCMPEEYHSSNAVDSYRQYYKHAKQHVRTSKELVKLIE